MCLSTPKVPKAPKPTLPRQAIQKSKPAEFEPQIGFGQTGRSGKRGLRIGRTRSDPVMGLGGLPGAGGGALQIGAQVPS